MRAVIFANGVMAWPASSLDLQPDDLIIAADGGSRHCLELGIVPSVIIGDFDSVSEEQLAEFEARGAQTIRYPAHKDFTDLELALDYARQEGARPVMVLGALGARWDQSLGNLLLPAVPAFAGMDIQLIDGPYLIRLLAGPDEMRLYGKPGDTVSLVPIGGDAQGITTQGLEYPLDDETLYFGATRGISNVFLGSKARVYLESGRLLVIMIHL